MHVICEMRAQINDDTFAIQEIQIMLLEILTVI